MKRLFSIVPLMAAMVLLTACGSPISKNEELPASSEETSISIQETQGGQKEEPESQPMYKYEVSELPAVRDGKQIYGLVYVPQAAGEKMPTVIYSHPYGATLEFGEDYAEALAERGYVVYCFDFCGGSYSSKSDGSNLEMSLFTEQSDLEAVISMLKEQPYVDGNELFLLGASQGGAVSAITAAADKDSVRGLILLYPAFVINDNAKYMFQSVDNIPETYQQLGMEVGKVYFEGLIDYDIYQESAGYDKDVLIMHGDADSLVPISFSEKAAETYPSARLEVIPGAGHGFHGDTLRQSIALILDYLEEHTG